MTVDKWDVVLLQDTFEFLSAGAGEAGCPVEFKTVPDLVNHAVVETGRVQRALLDRTYGSVLSLGRIEPNGPCRHGLAPAGFLGVTAGRYGVEIIAVLRRNLNQYPLGVFGGNHLALQGWQKTIAGERKLGRNPPRQFHLLGVEAQFEPHPSTRAGSIR